MKNKTIFSIIVILVGVIFSRAIIFSSKYKSDEYKKEYLVFVESKKKESSNMVTYNVFLGDKFKDKFVMKIYGSEDIDLTKYTDLKYGDVLSIYGKIVVPEYMNNPGEFNYKYYLYSNNIHGEISVNKINSVTKSKLGLSKKILSYIYNYKEYLSVILETHMSKEKAELTKSIIYGETVGLDEEIKTSFEQAGLSHIMAISGANITSIISVLSSILLLFKLKGKLTKLITLLAIFAFVILTGSSLSTLRAGIMAGATLVLSVLNKKIHPLKSLTLAVVLILIYAPYSIFNTGCILSFLATLGITLLYAPLSKLSKKVVNKIKVKWLKKIVEIALTNFTLIISVQIMIIPVQINSFNIISPTQVIFNILVSGLSNIITILGAIFILFSYVPILNYVVVKVVNVCISILLCLVKLFKSISLNILVMDIPLILVVLYYVIIFSFLLKIYLKDYIVKRKYEVNKKEWNKYTAFQIALLLIFLSLLILNNLYFVYIDSFVYFFNVGQGEMSYIKCGKNSVIVDIGSLKTNLAFNTISSYFKMKNISGVDAIILSHMHTDHINGLEKYLENYNVGIVLYGKQVEDTEEYVKFKSIVKKYNVETKEVKSGEEYLFGDIKIEVLFPNTNLINVEDNVNANSLVCKIVVKDKSIMYMGDSTKDTEEEILNTYNLEKINILKVSHHGSKTSTSDKYIKKILPEYAVISAKKSYYNHPHLEVIEVLKQYNVKMYITEKIGAIRYNL